MIQSIALIICLLTPINTDERLFIEDEFESISIPIESKFCTYSVQDSPFTNEAIKEIASNYLGITHQAQLFSLPVINFECTKKTKVKPNKLLIVVKFNRVISYRQLRI